jgi:NAD-dependent SIR2 family protein deacetylase
MSDFDYARSLIEKASKIAVLTGAGISTVAEIIP